MTEPNAEIVSLIAAHRRGDRRASEHLLARHKQDLWGYLVNHLPEREDAEDLYQEISMKVLGHAGELKDPGRYRSWLFSIAHNAVRSFFRKRRPELDEERIAVEPAPMHDGPEARFHRNERMRRLRTCLAKLNQREREILLLDTMAELPQADIAERMELNLNTVKTILRRTRIKLARMMTEEVVHG
ncbi:MAG: sigma-70 family RNA polymerase sigma factor [Acidobacteriota bacterium]|nr:sigma-70 family RNA polymerase sigma factor [Acidobacteriota bacterium]